MVKGVFHGPALAVFWGNRQGCRRVTLETYSNGKWLKGRKKEPRPALRATLPGLGGSQNGVGKTRSSSKYLLY